MRKFKFNLQRLLELKSSNLELLKIEIGKITVEINSLKSKIEKIVGEIGDVQKKLDSGMESIYTILKWMDYIRTLYGRRKEMVSDLSKLEDRLEEVRERYIEIFKEKKALENLKKIQKSQYDLEMLREEQKIIDDIGIQKRALR